MLRIKPQYVSEDIWSVRTIGLPDRKPYNNGKYFKNRVVKSMKEQEHGKLRLLSLIS